MNNTSANSILSFMTDYCHLHGFPKSIRADHGSCFTSFNFRNVCEKNNIKLVLCTVGDHRSNGAVERFIYTVKAKLLAMSFNEPKSSLNTSIDKIIWNIRLTKQSSIGCSPFARHFIRSPNTFWKSSVSHAISLDKGKSILSKDRAQDWGADDAFEDGYMENIASDNRGFESDPSDKTDRNLQRAPLSNPFSQGGNWFRKTVNRREGEPYFKPSGRASLPFLLGSLNLSILCISATFLILGDSPPCTQKNCLFTMAARGKASKDSIHALYTVSEYLARHSSLKVNTLVRCLHSWFPRNK